MDITQRMACELLNCSARTLSRYITKGWLTPDKRTKDQKLDFGACARLKNLIVERPELFKPGKKPSPGSYSATIDGFDSTNHNTLVKTLLGIKD